MEFYWVIYLERLYVFRKKNGNVIQEGIKGAPCVDLIYSSIQDSIMATLDYLRDSENLSALSEIKIKIIRSFDNDLSSQIENCLTKNNISFSCYSPYKLIEKYISKFSNDIVDFEQNGFNYEDLNVKLEKNKIVISDCYSLLAHTFTVDGEDSTDMIRALNVF